MKRLIISLLVLFLFPLMVSAQDFKVKVAVGLIVDPTIAAKIEYGNRDLEDFEGTAGTEMKLGLLLKNLEINYLRSNYGAEGKDSDSDITLTFDNEAMEVAVYLLDEPVKGGFNILAGAGLGVTKVSYEFSGCDSCDDNIYYRQTHLRLGLTYEFNDLIGFSGNWVNHIFSDADGFSATNSYMVIDASVRF